MELTEIEQKAAEQGWKPKDQFEGNESDFIDAGEFLRRGELFSKIKEVKDTLHHERQAFKAELNQVYSEVTKIRKTALEQAKRELQEQLRATDDKDEAIRLQTEVIKVEEELKEAKQPPVQQQPQVHPSYSKWLESNKDWYNVNSDMTMDADAIAAAFLRQNPGASPDTMLEHVDKKLQRLYPEKFEGAKKVSTPPQPSNADKKSSVSKTAKRSVDDLPEQARTVMKTLVKRGIVTEEKYLKDYFGE